MTIGTDFNAWFEGELTAANAEELVVLYKRMMIFWRDQAMKEAEQYQSLAQTYHESDLKLELRASRWKKLAKALRSDLLAANDELDALDHESSSSPVFTL